MADDSRSYYRGDQESGITGPNLGKTCTYIEHICHSRGKQTQFTSISLDRLKIRDFGETIYELLRDVIAEDSHVIIEHEDLVTSLEQSVKQETRSAKAQAVSALRRAQKRQEGLVDWRFDTSKVARKDLMQWSKTRVQKYFKQV